MKECMTCHKKISLFRRLSQQRFCSKSHEETFWAELQKLAVMRLHETDSTSRRAVLSSAVETDEACHNEELLEPVAVG